MQSAEIEVKFPVSNPLSLQARLPDHGFTLDTPRTFEHNTLYDTADRLLLSRRQVLRIRQYGGLWTLTHKRTPGPAEEAETGPYKVRIETETIVSDGAALAAVFAQLGYFPAFTYEKYRTEWSQPDHPGAHLVIDETPIGDYAELEGPTEWIDRTINLLGIDPRTCITESYGKLFVSWKARTGSPASNLTFDEILPAVLTHS